MNRDQWLAKRKEGLGATDISAILGKNPFRSPLDVYCEKTGLSEPSPETPAMRRGIKMEPIILKEYQEKTGFRIHPMQYEISVHDKHKEIFFSPDAYGASTPAPWDRIVEAKSVGFNSPVRKELGEPGTDQLPEHFIIQVQMGMLITGFKVADVPVSVAGEESEIYTVSADSELQGILLEEALRWWRDHIVAKNPPSIYSVSAQKASEWLKMRYPKSGNGLVKADPESIALFEMLKESWQDVVRRTEEYTAIENELKARIQESEGILGDNFKITWKKQQDTTGIDWEKAFEKVWSFHLPPSEDKQAFLEQFKKITRRGSRVLKWSEKI